MVLDPVPDHKTSAFVEAKMDRNTELLLAKAGQTTRWEDEEKSSNNLDVLRDEFRQRLYAEGDKESSQAPVTAATEEKKEQT